MSNKFLLTTESNAATNPLEEDLEANGHSLVGIKDLCLLSLSGNQICLKAEDPVTADYSLCLPKDQPVSGDILEITGVAPDFTSIYTPNSAGGVTNPLTANLDMGGFEIQNTTGTMEFEQLANTSMRFISSGSGAMQIITNGTLFLQSNDSALGSVFLDSIGGIALVAEKNISVASVTDFDVTSNGIVMEASGNGSSNIIKIECTGTNSGMELTSTGFNGVNINGSLFESDGDLVMRVGQKITIDNGALTFLNTTFGTTLLNPTSAAQNLSIRLPNNTPTVGGVMQVDTIVSGLAVTSFDSIPNILTDEDLLLNSVQVETNGGVVFNRTANGKFTRLEPSEVILDDYILKLPGSIGGIGPGEFGALISNDAGVMSFSGDITNIISAVEPLDNNDQIVMNNAAVPYTIKRAPAFVSSSRFSGMVDGLLPNNISNVIQITGTPGGTTFDISQSGDLLHIDYTDPQKIIYTQKTVPIINNITATPLGDPNISTIFVYIDGRSNPITAADVIQKTTGPGTKEVYETYLGNMDLAKDIIDNDVILKVFILAPTAYSTIQTLNAIELEKGHNIEGCVFGPTVATDLSLTHTAGKGIRLGVETDTDIQNPDRASTNAGEIGAVRYQYINAAGVNIVTTLGSIVTDPTLYNNNGSLIAVSPSSRFTVQYIRFFYGSNNLRITYGDEIFTNIAAARASVSGTGERFSSDTAKEAVLRGAYICSGDTVDNNVAALAEFIELTG